MRIKIILGLTLLILYSCGKEHKIEKEEIDYNQLSWEIFRGNQNLNGVSNSEFSDNFKLKWTFKTGRKIIASPVIAFGKVFIGSTDGKFYAVNLKTGKVEWEYDSGDDIEAPALILGKNIYIGNLSGGFISLNAKTGNVNWKTKLDSDIRGSANYQIVNDNVDTILFVGCYDTKMYAFNSSNGEILWQYKTGNYINGAPAVNENSVVFGGCDSKLHILDSSTGVKSAEVETGSYIPGSIVLDDNYSYLGKFDNKILKINIKEKKIEWEFEDKKNGDAFFASPAVNEKFVIAGSRNGVIYCLDKIDGKEIWRFKTKDDIDSSPVITKNSVIAASLDGRIYMIDLNSGKELWSYEVGASITSSPAVTGNIISFGAEDGILYTFEEVK